MSAAEQTKLEIRPTSIPDGLRSALLRELRRLNYTDATTIFYCVEPGYEDTFVGVFGDGENGAYEWFIWDRGANTLRTSDKGYGCVGVALCHGLVESGAKTANGDHDLCLAWVRC